MKSSTGVGNLLFISIDVAYTKGCSRTFQDATKLSIHLPESATLMYITSGHVGNEHATMSQMFVMFFRTLKMVYFQLHSPNMVLLQGIYSSRFQ